MTEESAPHIPYSIDSSGSYHFHTGMRPEEIISLAISTIERKFSQGELFTAPHMVKEFAILHLAQLEQEVFACMFLDTQHRLISFDTLFYGTIDKAAVYPREIVKRVLQYNAAAIICIHNHPSGALDPSQEDVKITKRIIAALELIDVKVLDHIVVGSPGSATSFAEQGLLP